MGIAANELNQHVIRPTLHYLNRHTEAAEALLLGIAASQSNLCTHLNDKRGHGLYRITEQSHQQLWDQFLAKDPDLASLIRGLASQHAFLASPHLELTVNLRYATAIAWMMIEAAATQPLPDANDVLGMARIWCNVFMPEGRPKDFISTWHRYVAKYRQVA